MHAIQEWINNHLIEWGIISSSANELDNAIVLLLIIAVTVGIDYACRYIFLNMFKRLAKRTRNQWAQDYQQADAHDPCHPGVCAVATGFPG